ncbi:MetQ/NlpA family ABC transporter substrate-binding protein [Clostridium sp. SYSU_GA19001]|uniref:MetQ/NlpA family ABC transporter substrate-binding protein n=1 Tax=Clostridium caldaquaticum TaxID=2940653 RepID=UPI00207718A5|nr:MetQ/NlpA family ABC transporter substrate-binding protein [Clostridium caldaquaticum]MCM8711663.1 MetQ/NlpA family ABC transporter substrate-binding protein [Clostridium caldaquaticum]
MKKSLSLVLTAILTIGLAGCGAKKDASAVNANATTNNDKKVIKVGATPVPHKEILEVVKPLLEKKGYQLEIKEFTDYVQPNISVNDGELDANFFQHVPYLENMNKEKGLKLDYTVKVHLEPMGVYSKKITSLNDLKDGATIAVPNDPTNEARALRVLEKAGLIKVKDGDLVTPLDITENTKNLKFKELEAAQLPRTLEDVEAAVINTNYALEAKLNPSKDALAIESKDSPFANILAVRKEDKDKPYIKALSEALTSPEVKKFIEEKYNGSIVPAF